MNLFTTPLPAKKSAPPSLGAANTQLHVTYIIAQTEDSIIIVDQHAADEV